MTWGPLIGSPETERGRERERESLQMCSGDSEVLLRQLCFNAKDCNG